MKHRVLFLCTGNSARSQMAEAIVNAHLAEAWQAYSAGTRPADSVNPHALQVLREVGIDHHGRPKGVDEVRSIAFDLVVTVCDAAAEACPAWLGAGRRLHLGFPDPAAADPAGDALTAFRQVRDRMAVEIPGLLIRYTPP